MPTPPQGRDDPYVELTIDGQYVILTKSRAFGMLDEVVAHHPEVSRMQARMYAPWRILELMSPVIAGWADEWEHTTHD